MEHRGDALWMDDGAKYHTSKIVQEYEKALFIHRMWWPAQSPNLNPIENLWRIIKLRISKRRHRIQSISEMEEVIREEWAKLTPNDWQKCIKSIEKRCRLILKARGGAINY